VFYDFYKGTMNLLGCYEVFLVDMKYTIILGSQVVAVDTFKEVKWVQRFGDEVLDCREGEQPHHPNQGILKRDVSLYC
jgi:hypothetical protein